MKSRAFKPGMVQTGVGLLMTKADQDRLHEKALSGDKECLYYTIEDMNGKRHSIAECKGSAKVLKLLTDHFGVLTFEPHRKCQTKEETDAVSE